MGRTVAIEAAKRGANIAIGGRSEKEGLATFNTIRALTGQDALFVPGDLQDVNQCRNLARRAMQMFGKITGFLCYAGILPAASVINTDEELFNSVFDLNIKAAFFCCKYIIPAMIQAGGGSIVTIGSIQHILYLLSDASSMVTGSELHITGGY